MAAYDAQRQRNKAYKQVFVTVIRNQGPPIWLFDADAVTIREDHPRSALVTTVTAEDTTDNVSRHKIYYILLFCTVAHT